MNDSFCSSELLLYVVVSSLRQLAHGPHTSTSAKNRAGSPHSMYPTSQLIARHVGKDFSSSMEEITGQPREKAPAAVQLAFWEESYSRSVGPAAAATAVAAVVVAGPVLGQGLIRKGPRAIYYFPLRRAPLNCA